MKTSDIERLEREQHDKTFTSFKFDMIDGMLVDPRLLPSDFKVAVALLQFMNKKTGELYPAQSTLSELVGLKRRALQECLNRLKDAGWLTWSRGNRQKSNEYQFDHVNLEPMRELRKAIEEGRNARKDASKRERSDARSSASREILMRGTAPLQMRAPALTNTLREHSLDKRAAK